MKKIAINASNLHGGGGAQVACSFLHELSIDNYPLDSFSFFVSTVVDENLKSLQSPIRGHSNYNVVDVYGIKAFLSPINKILRNFDLIFTVFGPNYSSVKGKLEIVGFAQPWLLNFNNPISKKMPFFSKNILRLKFYIQWLFFMRADHYVVELEHVKKGLVEKKGVDCEKISIVYNSVSSLYKNKSQWQPIHVLKNKEEILLGIVARDYPHKNLNILPMVAEALEAKHNLKAHFYTTLNDDEWAAKDAFFKRYVSTIGSLSPDQCPSFYEQIDAVVFPSLLECFSATPLEAMVMSKPLFASDRGFVRDVCGGHAVYFDPLDANDIALKIANYFKADTERSEQLQQARDHALGFSSAKGRAEQYLEIIQQHLKG